MTDIIYKIIILVLLLYPVAIGFCFSVKGLKTSKRIYYAALAILLALSNMILVIATYYGGFTRDSWLNFIFFFLFELLLLVTSVLHFVMVLGKFYNHKRVLTLSVFLLISGICYSVSLMIFSNPDASSSEGLAIADALLSLLPTLLSATFFALAGSDKEAFLPSLKPFKKKKSDTKD